MHGLQYCGACISISDLVALRPVGLPGPEIESTSRALAGRFLTIRLPGKSHHVGLYACQSSLNLSSMNDWRFMRVVLCIFQLKGKKYTTWKAGEE